MLPRYFIIFYAVALGVWGIECYLTAAVEFAFLWRNGVQIGFAGLLMAYLLPYGKVDANAGESFGACKHDVAFLVIPCVVFVLLQHRKLYGVYHF